MNKCCIRRVFFELFNLIKYVRYNQLILKKIAVYKPNAVKIYLIWYDTGKNEFNFCKFILHIIYHV